MYKEKQPFLSRKLITFTITILSIIFSGACLGADTHLTTTELSTLESAGSLTPGYNYWDTILNLYKKAVAPNQLQILSFPSGSVRTSSELTTLKSSNQITPNILYWNSDTNNYEKGESISTTVPIDATTTRKNTAALNILNSTKTAIPNVLYWDTELNKYYRGQPDHSLKLLRLVQGDFVIDEDTRIQPIAVLGNATVVSALNTKQDSAAISIGVGQTETVTMHLPALSAGGLFTYQVDASDVGQWVVTAEESLDSTDGSDGTWSSLSVSAIWEPFGPGPYLQKIDLPVGESKWIRISLQNNDTVSNELKNIGLRKFSDTGEDDYWLFLGASITSMGSDYSGLHERAMTTYNQDPIIFNRAFSGKTTSWLDDNIDAILAEHPKSRFVTIHMGGNNVSNSRPYTEAATSYLDDMDMEYRSIISKIQTAGKTAIPARLTFRAYPNEPGITPGTYAGGLPQYGSLPYNTNIIDPIIQSMTPDFYDNVAGHGSVDLYTGFLNNQEKLNTDGVHLLAEGTETWMDLWRDTAMKIVYTGKQPTAMIPKIFDTPAEAAEKAVLIAETSTEQIDIDAAQVFVTALNDWDGFTTEYTDLQARINAIVPTTALRYNIDFGGIDYRMTPGNWNNITDPAVGSVNLITDTGIASTINVTITSPFPNIVNDGGNEMWGLPLTAMQDAFTPRAYLSIDPEITISGLNASKTYTLKFFSSFNTETEYITTFVINGVSQSITSTNNDTDIVTFSDITPDENNEIIVTVDTPTNYGYLNTLVIRESAGESAPTCTDSVQNGDETGVDCGGSCAACVPAFCSDTVQSGDETGIDCGGSCPTVCPTCSDSIQNGDETGVDCGGSCSACTDTTYLIDFGLNSTPGNWNILVDYMVDDQIVDLLDDTGTSSAIDLTVTARFGSKSTSGYSTVESPYPNTAKTDMFYVASGDTASMKVSSLNISKKYNFTFYASRSATGDRTTDFTIDGTTVSLNAANNDTNTVTISDVTPAGDGTIDIAITANASSSYGYLNVLEITEHD